MTSDPPVYELRVVEPDDTSRAIVSTADRWVTEPVVDRAGAWIAFGAVDVSSRAFVVSWTFD